MTSFPSPCSFPYLYEGDHDDTMEWGCYPEHPCL